MAAPGDIVGGYDALAERDEYTDGRYARAIRLCQLVNDAVGRALLPTDEAWLRRYVARVRAGEPPPGGAYVAHDLVERVLREAGLWPQQRHPAGRPGD